MVKYGAGSVYVSVRWCIGVSVRVNAEGEEGGRRGGSGHGGCGFIRVLVRLMSVRNMCPQLYQFKIILSTAVTKIVSTPAPVEAAVVSCVPPSRIEIALLVDFVFVQPVLKWLHQPPSKNVMLTQPASSSHDFLHAARSETLLDDWLR